MIKDRLVEIEGMLNRDDCACGTLCSSSAVHMRAAGRWRLAEGGWECIHYGMMYTIGLVRILPQVGPLATSPYPPG